jgi:polyhydroxyalkanoate synthesis regulator phasin
MKHLTLKAILIVGCITMPAVSLAQEVPRASSSRNKEKPATKAELQRQIDTLRIATRNAIAKLESEVDALANRLAKLESANRR